MDERARARLAWLCTSPDLWPEGCESGEDDPPPELLPPEREAELLALVERTCGPVRGSALPRLQDRGVVMPSYKSNDPKGWIGNPRYGAALGRDAIHEAPKDQSIDLVLRRVSIDSQGYDVNGTYFGTPDDLWWYADEEGQVDDVLRASCREAAEAGVKKIYPLANIQAPAVLAEEQYEEFVLGYLETALFTAQEDEKENARENKRKAHDLSWDDIPDETRIPLRAVCRKFWDEHRENLLHFSLEHSLHTAGYCLFEKGAGFGVGFADRYHYKDPDCAIGELLDAAARGTTPELVVTCDGKIYC